MSLLKDLLTKNPVVLNKYVALGFAVVDKTVAPLNKLMVHLLEVKGIDPKTQPGESNRKALINAIDQVQDTNDFDADFNFAPAAKAFGKLKHLNISRDQFKKSTDLSNLSDVPQIKEAAPQVKSALVWDRKEPSTLEKSYDNHLDELKSFMDKYNVAPVEVPVNLESLKDALKTINIYAGRLHPTERVEGGREAQAVGRVKRSAQPVTVTKTFKKGLFRRITKGE